ncbi:hypothetical protein M0R04_03120 [Candidatus Dojkabacteria bacterium]|jgi:hypothetical protein|nr:hypothetical protein [Candidatus Dojkabacteria bacterium]
MDNEMKITEKEKYIEEVKAQVFGGVIPGLEVTFGNLPFRLANEKLRNKEYKAKIEAPDESIIKQVIKKKRPLGDEYTDASLRFSGITQIPKAEIEYRTAVAKASVVYEKHLREGVTKEDIRNYFFDRIFASITKSIDYCLWQLL